MVEDLTGRRFGQWFVVERGDDHVTYPPARGRAKVEVMWTCKCSCETCETRGEFIRSVPGTKLRAGRSLSCGRAMELTCTIEGCAERRYADAYCSGHFYRFTKYGDPLGGVENAKVYAIQAGPGGPFKIGMTTGPATKRLRGLQTSHYLLLHLVGFTAETTENRVHTDLRPYRIRGEWFRDCPEVRTYLSTLFPSPRFKDGTPEDPVA